MPSQPRGNGKPLSRTWVWHFDSAPEAVWPLLADTARFNEAARLPKHEIEEIPQPDGSVLYLGRARIGPFRLTWREKPVNWVSPRWFEHCRHFRNGPLRSLCARLTLSRSASGSRAEYTIEAAPTGPLGHLILRAGFFENAGRTFGTQAETANRFALGQRDQPFEYAPPRFSAEAKRRTEALVTRIEETGHGHGLTRRLADFIMTAQEVDLFRIRPLRLARDWGAEERYVIELCLEATRAGLLGLRWDLLCPRCRVAKSTVSSLDHLPRGAHCPTCNIDYDRDFSKNVELSFQPAPSIRPIEQGEYCLFGPMSTPHIRMQLTLAPEQSEIVNADLPFGSYRLRTLEPGPEEEIAYQGSSFPEIIVDEKGVRTGPAGEPGKIKLRNASGRDFTMIVEERAWIRDALTADRVTALQSFRDLFSDQVLRPGDEVAVRRVALMFTDLRASTALYSRVGDASAYQLVRAHFAFLGEIVREHNGAIVKTIGDAIMAAFADPSEALKAALDVQLRIAEFNATLQGTAIKIRLGLHEGPCIAVTLNDRLDYFGSTVNLAARLQDQSRGGDIVLSREMAEEPAVAALLAAMTPSQEWATLKGFDRPVEFLRLVPRAEKAAMSTQSRRDANTEVNAVNPSNRP